MHRLLAHAPARVMPLLCAMLLPGCVSWRVERQVIRQYREPPHVEVVETAARFEVDAHREGGNITVTVTRDGDCAEVTRTPVVTETAVRYARESSSQVLSALMGTAFVGTGIGLMAAYPSDPCDHHGVCRPGLGMGSIALGLISFLAMGFPKAPKGQRDHTESLTSWQESRTPSFSCHDGPAADVLLTMPSPDGTAVRALTDRNGVARLPLPPELLKATRESVRVTARAVPPVTVEVLLGE